MCDDRGNVIPGRRCNCRRGHLLFLADEAREKRLGIGPSLPLLREVPGLPEAS